MKRALIQIVCVGGGAIIGMAIGSLVIERPSIHIIGVADPGTLVGCVLGGAVGIFVSSLLLRRK
jgi:hypothetical protein